MMMRVLPKSLFGRLVLVLASGLVIAQLLSATINLVERDSMLLQVSGMRPAQRVADAVKLLDSLGAADRARVVGILSVPPLSVSLDRPPLREESLAATVPQARMFSAVLRNSLGDDRPVVVAVVGPSTDQPSTSTGEFGRRAHPMGGPGMHRFAPPGTSILTQVRLNDGTWATFDTQITPAAALFPWRLLLTLAILLVAVLVVSYIAVRWVTKPLHALAAAADELGRDIHRPPLPETGPIEVSRAAHAFNTMQSRLVRLIEDRARILAAMSHDLKTPITRMRLRAELLDDEETRAKFEKDLQEMESMVTETLDFMRDIDVRAHATPIDVAALMETVAAENAEMGRTLTVAGSAAPYIGVPQLLKRCIANLIDNAVVYGTRADIAIDDSPKTLTIRVRDRGPGIPDAQLEKVFEPFVRLEGSRSRETGGTGLGLCIARNIARAHGGDVTLKNRDGGGGLEATITLPRG